MTANNELIEQKVREFENLFWLHRIPRNTKQAAAVGSFLRTAFTELLAQQRANDIAAVEEEMRIWIARSSDAEANGFDHDASRYHQISIGIAMAVGILLSLKESKTTV